MTARVDRAQTPIGPPVTVVIPVHNAGENFRRCMASVAAALSPDDEVIVVADGESDGSWKCAEEFGARIVSLPVSSGPARARNVGAREASGDLLVFIDADIVIPPDTLTKIKAAFRSAPELAALFGSYDEEPADPGFLSQYKNLFHHYMHQTAQENAFTFWTGCGAIRRKVFTDLGGFDERYRRPSIEDIELGYRLRKAGHHIRLVRDIAVKHLKRWEVFPLLMSDIRFRAAPWAALILCEGGMCNDLNLKITNRLSVACVCLLSAALGGALFEKLFWIPVLLLSAALLTLNWQLYSFFREKRGFLFALRTIPWHWLYYLYSGLVFMTVLAGHMTKRKGHCRSAQTPPDEP